MGHKLLTYLEKLKDWPDQAQSICRLGHQISFPALMLMSTVVAYLWQTERAVCVWQPVYCDYGLHQPVL